MTEATGCEAQTLHRLLEVNGNPEGEQTGGFGRNEENPLEADVIIIDEMSMVDLSLFHARFKGSDGWDSSDPCGGRQSASISGTGSVLKDMIKSECFPVVRLNKIFRQAGKVIL